MATKEKIIMADRVLARDIIDITLCELGIQAPVDVSYAACLIRDFRVQNKATISELILEKDNLVSQLHTWKQRCNELALRIEDMEKAREQALEEAAAILDKFQVKCLENDNKEKAFEHGLTAADIRALKNKGV